MEDREGKKREIMTIEPKALWKQTMHRPTGFESLTHQKQAFLMHVHPIRNDRKDSLLKPL